MKRALLIFVAALIVLFTCPSTDLIAGTGKPCVTNPDVLPKPDGPVGVDDADGDDGDADDIAGFKSKWDLDGVNSSTSLESDAVKMIKLWWSWFLWYR